ncbi:MAG: fluoride efflux transporter CrcB [Pseudomonadota bacterium]
MSALTQSPFLASIYVAAGGAIGAVARYQLGRAVTYWTGAGAGFPWATLAANVLGCFAMGALFGWLARHGAANESVRLLLGVGLLGGFTTFSAFSLEVLLLAERGAHGSAVAYILVSVLAGIGALYAGLIMARGLA